jgi:hypothetical protein
MERERDLHRADDRDVVGQVGVERIGPLPRRKRAVGVEVRDLPLGVDARVGAAGADHQHLPPFDLLQRPLQLALDRGLVLLQLPAVEIGAVVLDDDADVPRPSHLLLDDDFGDLHRVERRALQDVVRDDPQVEAVRDRPVLADAADERLAAAADLGGRREVLLLLADDDARAPS